METSQKIAFVPNPNKIKVGYGYRLLGDQEIIQVGDSFRYRNSDHWQEQTGHEGKAVGLFILSYSIEAVRRKIDVGEGYRLADINETVGNGYSYTYYNHVEHAIGKWSGAYNNGKTVGSHWDSSSTDNIQYAGVAYRVKIETPYNYVATSDGVKLSLEDQIAVKQKELVDLQGKLEESRSVMINGYKAKVVGNCVEFGCAKIDKTMISHLHYWICNEGYGNRIIESITIGKGVFSKGDIQKLKSLIQADA